jgi:glycosyltransferase involved in cell wall biosynthesis
MAQSEFRPLVSIIIPVYNGSNYLSEAIDSALAQTYEKIEIIVVNDGSKDGGKTREIALSYGDRIRYFEKENGGVATALNYGIEKMRGEYLAWLSHDDEFLPHKLADQIKLLHGREDREDIVLFGNFTVHNVFTDTRYDAEALDPQLMDRDPRYRWLQAIFSSKIHGCTSLIPKKCLDRVGPFDVGLRTTQDYDYFCRLLQAGVKFVYQDKSLIMTRHHQAQDTHRILDIHLCELKEFFARTIDSFANDLNSYEFLFIEHFLNTLKARGQTDAYVHLFNSWSAKQCAKDAPPLWLYWECPEGKSIPDYICLCWKSMALHCARDYRLTIVTPNNLRQHLPHIDPCYKQLAAIAHRADFIRFNLLYEHGGVWMDSDFILFRSLRQVMDDIRSTGFAAMGYQKEREGDFFPIIAFLASQKHNEIARTMVEGMKENIHRILEVEKRQPAWDEIGGYPLSEAMKRAKCGYIFYDAMEYFSLCPYWQEFIPCLERTDIASMYHSINPKMFGQALTNSRDMDTLSQYSEEQILREDYWLSNLFKISFSGVRHYTPSFLGIHSGNPQWQLLSEAIASPRRMKAEIKANLRRVPLLRPIYHKIYKPTRSLAGRIRLGIFSASAWGRLWNRATTAVFKKSIAVIQKTANSKRWLSPFSRESVKDVFTQADKSEIGDYPESRSSEGSIMAAAKILREHLPRLVRRFKIEKCLALPCGDYNWMKDVELGLKQYIGGDIFREYADSNAPQSGNSNTNLLQLDLIRHSLPKADMILCRDYLIHLSFDDIDTMLKNLHRSGIKYLLTSTYPDQAFNHDIATGQFRPVNLQAKPFNFSDPLWIVNEESTDTEGGFADKSLALWLIADLPHSLGISRRQVA